ncbi:MAG: RagB/SusD family nutrient uptake outer membrane protein [Balneolales bacterium]
MISCSDDFLSPDPRSFHAPENVYVDVAGFESIIMTMRYNLKAEHSATVHAHPYMMDQWAMSEAGVPGTQLDLRATMTPAPDFRYNFTSLFSQIYENIKDTNILLTRIDDVEDISTEDKNRLKAEALWHRSYWYLRAVNTYGDVPFVSEEVSGPKLDYQTHSRHAVLDRIQAEMEWAVDHLPPSAEDGAPSKGAGDHLLAKIYLSNLQFDDAVEAASRVINGPYGLMTDRFGIDADDPQRNVQWDLHRPENRNSSENTENILSIVARPDAPPAARTGGSRTMRLYGSSWWINTVTDSQGNAGMIDDGPMYDSLGRGNSNMRPTYWWKYGVWNEDGALDGLTHEQVVQKEWDTPDIRRADINWQDESDYLYNHPESENYGERYRREWLQSEADTKRVHAQTHYKLYNPQHDDNTPFGGEADWYIFRLAETYLIRAEAHYWNDDPGLAADDINKVRERSNASTIMANDVTIDYIFDERARELFMETPRQNELVRASYTLASLERDGYSLDNLHEENFWYDRMMKHNKFFREEEFHDFALTARIDPHQFLWPIPDAIITANTQGVINQNTGYVGDHRNEEPLETVDAPFNF